jgi:nucleotide-binding universal stress UspA family protein
MDLAVQDFQRARRQATVQEVMARLTGKSADLFSFHEVREKLKATGGVDKGLVEIALEAIVGSVGRYEDFTRTFLPRRDSDKERWARVKIHVSDKGLADLPPILVYQIGAAYFVEDGNHRVSVARRMGASHIRAYVTDLQTRVSLSLDDRPDDLIIKAEYADFLERTNLDIHRPGVDLRATVPGKFWILEAQIEAHRYLIPGNGGEIASYQEAAGYWYDGIYSGFVQVIRDRGLLLDFPDRTETDFYLWFFEHRSALKQQLDWDVTSQAVLADLAAQHQPKTKQPKKSAAADHSRLFCNVLVAVTGEEKGWQALEQGLIIAKRERGKVWGFHLVASETGKETAQVKWLRDEFNQRCQAAGITGQLTLEVGPAVDKICERACLADLVVAPLLNPPGARLIGRLSSEFRSLVQRCARPVLAIPEKVSSLNRALLAYDGSARAREALFVAAYLSGRWQIRLFVLTVVEDSSGKAGLQAEARTYLEKHGIQAHFVQKSSPFAPALFETCHEYEVDFIIMGGYSQSPLRDLVLGASVDQALHESKYPILICR